MNHYSQNHKIAKLIICCTICALLYLDGTLSIYAWLAVVIWIFGTNPIAWVIESARGDKHEHDKV